MRRIREQLHAERQADINLLVAPFYDTDGITILRESPLVTLLLMQPQDYFEGKGRMEIGRPERTSWLPNKEAKLGERVGNMLAALYPRKFRRWGTPKTRTEPAEARQLLRTTMAEEAGKAYARLGERRMKSWDARSKAESPELKAMRLLPDLRRLWANCLNPGYWAFPRPEDALQSLPASKLLAGQLLNLYHLGTSLAGGLTQYELAENTRMSIQYRQNADEKFVNKLEALAKEVIRADGAE